MSFSGNFWDDTITITDNYYITPPEKAAIELVDDALAVEEEDARDLAITKFWIWDRRYWLAEAKLIAAIRENVSKARDEMGGLREQVADLEAKLAAARRPKARPPARPTKPAKKRKRAS